MTIDPKDVNEDGIHTGFTTPPNEEPSPTGRHLEKTTVPNVVVPVSDTVDGPREGSELRAQVEQAADRAVHPGRVTPDVVPAETGNEPSKEDDVKDSDAEKRIADAEQRATEQEQVGKDKPKASTRQVKPGEQR